MRTAPPRIDDEVRRRLTARFGDEISPWFGELPAALGVLAERWQVDLDSFIPRGSMSIVIRCRLSSGRPAVLKIGPDRTRMANEGAALERWTSSHTPSVLAVDESAGALLIEAIEPGTPLIDSPAYPDLKSVAELLMSLHTTGAPDPSYPPLAHHIEYLFNSGTRPYERRPDLATVVAPELYERGRRFAAQLVERVSSTALLHGDLTPNNILDGGNQRGLVAIDPAPCLGDDVAFDAVDLLFWQAGSVNVIAARAEQLAPAIGVEASRLLDWCTAFAGMVALELAEAPNTPRERIEALVSLAEQAPAR